MGKGLGGCLTLVGIVLVIPLAAGALLGARIVQPAALERPSMGPDDGARAQQKIFTILRRGRGTEPGGQVVLTEGELNAFLERHLTEAADLPFSALIVRLPLASTVEFAGRLPIADLIGDSALFSGVSSVLPGRWLRRPLWMHLRARAGIEPGSVGRRRYLRLEVERFAVGRQPLPASLARLLLSPSALRLLRWPLPPSVDTLSVEPGRAVIAVAASRSRTGAADRR